MDFNKGNMINNALRFDEQTPQETGPNGRPVKMLTPQQAIIGATVLFELNVNPQELIEMAEKASLPYGDDEPEGTEKLRREWFGFVHAGVTYALMGRAPQQAVAGYLGTTLELMERFAGYDRAATDDFIDSTLTGYMELLTSGEQRKCPDRLLSRVVGENYADVLSTDQIAFMSGMMAITLCNILDTLERYSFSTTEQAGQTEQAE